MTNVKRGFRLAASTVLASVAVTSGALAQAPVDDATDESDVIVVTGTSRARAAHDTPLAVTAIDEERLAKLSVSSQADILNTVPTIKADGGGGEVATNVFVKGLPSGGQYQFTPLMYDGIPVLSSFGLNSSAYDVYYRNDLGIQRLEFVRGGVSNLFGAGSVAGLINYISRTGGSESGGVGQLEVGEDDRYRGDLALSGPLGGNWFYGASGYYRTDAGPLETDLDTEGFQLRGNLKHEFRDGSGSFTVFGQYIDDQVQFYLPVPLNGASRSRARGNDGSEVFSVQHSNTMGLGFQTPDGPFTSDINDGVSTRGGAIALAFDKDLGDGWGINGRAKYADYDHRFGLWSDGDGVINVPETLQSFLTNRSLGSTANANFTFVGGGPVPANFLLFANRFTDRERPATDMTTEFNITREATLGAFEHTLTLGAFYASAEAEDINRTTTYLAEFNNTPRLVSLVVTNPMTMAQTIISRNGLLNAGAGYTNNKHEATRYAIYGADQFESDRWALDLGFRYEQFEGDIRRERTATFVTDATTPNLSTALRDVIWGNDTFLTANVDASEYAVAAGALFKVNDAFNIYGNFSRGYFFPEIRAVGFNALGQPATYDAEIIYQGALGLKYDGDRFSGTISGLYTELNNRRQVLFLNDGMGGFREQVNIVATESYAVEATATLRLTDNFTVDGNLTLQDHEYTAFDTTPGNVGKDLERQPDFLYNAGLYYDNDRLDVAIFTNYTGDNFTAANNAIVLDGWNVVNLDAGYTFGFGGDRSARLGVNVFNLLDEDATTEGSPRQDVNQTTGGAFFVGRPVLPRRVIARVTVNF